MASIFIVYHKYQGVHFVASSRKSAAKYVTKKLDEWVAEGEKRGSPYLVNRQTAYQEFVILWQFLDTAPVWEQGE